MGFLQSLMGFLQIFMRVLKIFILSLEFLIIVQPFFAFERTAIHKPSDSRHQRRDLDVQSNPYVQLQRLVKLIRVEMWKEQLWIGTETEKTAEFSPIGYLKASHRATKRKGGCFR